VRDEMRELIDERNKRVIRAGEIILGDDVELGKNIDVDVRGRFYLGNRSRLGDDCHIRGNNVIFGEDCFNSSGLRVGGGGRMHPRADLKIGDRCTFHNNFINVCETVMIDNDVGLSPEVSILTHGYWQSVLEGHPVKFGPVRIRDGVIVGYRSLILPSVRIGENAVIGAQSVVTKDLEGNAIYAGNPAKKIRDIPGVDYQEKLSMMQDIIAIYKEIAEYHGLNPRIVYSDTNYPLVRVNNCVFNVETLTFEGEEDKTTDDFRDYVRKWGLRFYSKRPFRSVWK